MEFNVKETRRGNRYSLVGITQEDVYFSNLAARQQPGSQFAPKHVIGIWINRDGEPSKELAETIASYGFNVKSISKYDWLMKGNNDDLKDAVNGDRRLKAQYMEDLKYFMVFTVYPKKDPKIYIQTTKNRIKIEPENLSIVDSTRITEMGIEWSEYVYMNRMVASVDYILVLADESAAEEDESYIDVVYKNPDVEIIADDEEDERPFG